MLNYNEITEKKFIELDGDPYEVISSHVFRKQQRKPVNATKLRNLITGKVAERSFHQSEKAKEAQIEKKEIKYLYTNKEVSWFCDKDNPKDRFEISKSVIGGSIQFIKENSLIESLVFNDKIIKINPPIKVDLKVREAPPAVKGNTSGNATKQIVLETGDTVQAPLFINEGDIIRINTETGEYTERVS